MNTVTISNHRRPFHTRLCLESLARAQRWYKWADKIAVCLSPNATDGVAAEALGVIDRNPDIPFEVWCEPQEIYDPHAASKWMFDHAFAEGSDINLYVEDDVVVSSDAFLLLEAISHPKALQIGNQVIGACLYHETIPEHYLQNKPDPRRLHLCNGLNTCGGTAFLRKPYLEILGPQWNCKQVEPLGFDYSAHYLMYLHKLYMVYPDLSRSMNLGFTGGALSQAQWAKYCGRSIWAQTLDALRDWRDFRLDGGYPEPVREGWMEDEHKHRGLL